MVSIVECLLLIPILWLVSFAAYLLFNHGLAPNRRRQQFFRYLVASVVTVVPLAVTATSPFQPIMVFFLGATMITKSMAPLVFISLVGFQDYRYCLIVISSWGRCCSCYSSCLLPNGFTM